MMGVVANRIPVNLSRASALAATLASAISVSMSHERVYLFGVTLEAKFSGAPAFKYFVIVNIIASAYSLAVIFLPLAGLLAELVLALDVVFTMLLMSSTGAALAIAQVGQKGNNQQVGYQYVTKYKDVGFIFLIIYLIVLLYGVVNISPLLSKY